MIQEHYIYCAFYFYFLKIIFNWRMIALQYWFDFCHTSTWISHRYTYVPSHLPPFPTPLGCYRAPVWVPWVIQQSIKLLEENIGRTLYDMNHGKILYDPPPRIMEIKTKINKWDLIKLKSFCTAKETITKLKRQPSEWKKIKANETADKGLISKIYK